MKLKALAASLILAAGVLRATAFDVPSLVSLWHGEGDAQDSVGSNHGLLINGVSFIPGVSGQAFRLGGSGFIRVPDNASLDLTNELTIQMWFKLDSGGSGVLIDKRDWTTCNFGAIISPQWGFQLYYDDPNISQGNQYELSFSPYPSTEVWHHFAGTYKQVDGSHVEMRTYMDGQPVQTNTHSGRLATTLNSIPLAIGSARDGVDGFFQGAIDEVAIYNYALSPSEVFSNFNNVTPPPPPPPPPPATPMLVSLWHGEGDAQDSVGSNHGTLMSGVGFTQGVVGQGFLLDGMNDYIRVPDSASLHVANEVTVEMWFRREDASSYGTLIDKRNWTTCNYGVIMSPDWGFLLYYNDPNINDGNLFEISFSSVPAPGVFHHLAGTFQQVDSGHVEMKTYIDGQLVRTDIRRGNLANTFNGDALAIGSARDGVDGFFRGVIDEVALYNYALSASQVYSNYSLVTLPPPPPPPPPNTNTAGSLVALWHADGNAQDSVGNNHGQALHGVAFAPGIAGQGFLLDGVDDYIRVPDSVSLHLANELSLELWFKRADASSYGALIDKRNLNTCNFGVIVSGDWGLQLYYDDPAIRDGNQYEISFTAVPSAGVFHHLVGTFRQVSSDHVKLDIYVDGQLVRTDTLRGNLGNTFNGDALAIGTARDGAGGFFRGVIDEVALYNYALNSGQVLSNYLALSSSAAPQIVTQPASQTIVLGDPVTFTVNALGVGSLQFQWRYAGGTLSGETSTSLTLSAAQLSDAGDYDVIVANDSGSVTSAVAVLTVTESGLPPSFVSAPLPFYSASVGGAATLSTTVSGTPPFVFQWTFDGVTIPGATNVSLVLSNVQPENAGVYQLFVTNDYGAIASGGTTLSISMGNVGTFNFANLSTNLVLDVNGVSGVPQGTGYVAAIFVGIQSNSLTAIGSPAGFIFPGRFNGGLRTVPLATAGQTVFAEVKVWNLSVSAVYEEAVALGGKHGSSGIFPIVLGGGLVPPAQLFAMNRFSLQAGTGIVGHRKIQSANGVNVTLGAVSRLNGATSFILTGPVGATLAIEASTDLQNWVVLDHVVNNSGALKFVDESVSVTNHRFYRARVATP